MPHFNLQSSTQNAVNRHISNRNQIIRTIHLAGTNGGACAFFVFRNDSIVDFDTYNVVDYTINCVMSYFGSANTSYILPCDILIKKGYIIAIVQTAAAGYAAANLW